MKEIVAIVLVAGIFVLFGLLVRARRGCPGAEACEEAREPGGCHACDANREMLESSDA